MHRPNTFRDNTVIVIDSLDRDIAKYPNPNEYVIKLPSMLRNVDTIELISLQLTRIEPNVNTGNNTFKLSVNNVQYKIVIPVGEILYGEVLATTLEEALSSIVPDTNTVFSVLFDRKLTITNSTNSPFTITVDENVAKLLGIIGKGFRGSGTVSSSPEGVLVGNRIIDLNGTPYIILSINDYNRVVSSSNNAHTGFMTIPMERYAVGERFIINGDEKERKGVYMLTNGQRNIYEFRISFRRPDGSLYDFEGINHLITFRVYRHDNYDFPY